jgi:hypothetical protein
MTFSWRKSMEQTIQDKITRAKIQAKAGHPDFKMDHPDECRDANQNNYTKLTKRITDDIKTKQKLQQQREEKTH